MPHIYTTWYILHIRYTVMYAIYTVYSLYDIYTLHMLYEVCIQLRGPECASILAERDLRKLLPAETIDRLLVRDSK